MANGRSQPIGLPQQAKGFDRLIRMQKGPKAKYQVDLPIGIHTNRSHFGPESQRAPPKALAHLKPSHFLHRPHVYGLES
jgi:hypothetical protein